MLYRNERFILKILHSLSNFREYFSLIKFQDIRLDRFQIGQAVSIGRGGAMVELAVLIKSIIKG